MQQQEYPPRQGSDTLQHVAVKLTHYASEMDNAYSGGPP